MQTTPPAGAAAAVAVAELSYLIHGPFPGIKAKDMTPAQLAAVRAWVIEDPAEQEARCSAAFKQLGYAVAMERERRFWDKFLSAGS